MAYTEEYKQSMKGLELVCPALKEFSHDVKNHIAAAITNLHLLEKAESPVQAEMYRARTMQSLDEAVKMFREVNL